MYRSTALTPTVPIRLPDGDVLRFDGRPAVALRIDLTEANRTAEVRAAATTIVELPEGVIFRWLDPRDLLLRRRSVEQGALPPGIWP